MALTPTALIAVTGIMSGGGFGISSTMTSLFSSVNSNSIVSGAGTLSNPLITANVTGLSATLSSLPPFIANASATSSSALTQAQKILPGAGTAQGNRNFLQAFGGASSFGSASAEYAAALSTLGNKSFGDLGVGVSNFSGVLSNGVTSLLPMVSKGFAALQAQAHAQSFGSLASVIPTDPNQAGSLIANGAFQSVGSSMKNFGTAYDFTNLQSVGTPQALVASLQKQGLSSTYGIDDQISYAGYNPKNLSTVPSSVLTTILAGIQGSDLTKIVSTLGVNSVKQPTSLSDLLNLETFMPTSAIGALGLNTGSTGLTGLGNSLTNLGVQSNNLDIGNMIGQIQTKSYTNLNNIQQVIPTSVSSALTPLLGTGSSPFGTPTMNDMVGSAAGATHTNSFNAIQTALTAIMSTSQGQAVSTAMSGLITAYNNSTDPATDALVISAEATLSSAVSALNAQIAGNAGLSQQVAAANSAITASQSQITKENNHLSLAGVTLPTGNTPANLGSSMTPFLSFGTKLHDYGVDRAAIGYSSMLENVATNDVTGDALQATLAEGRTLASTSVVGKTTPAVSDAAVATSAALQAQVPSLTTAVATAQQVYQQAISSGLSGTQLTVAQNNFQQAQAALAKAQQA